MDEIGLSRPVPVRNFAGIGQEFYNRTKKTRPLESEVAPKAGEEPLSAQLAFDEGK